MTKSRMSIWTTWIIRILLILVALIALSLLALSNIGGTSESHKKGLEQAFSDFLKADVQIGKIDEFNILPQLSFKLAGVKGVFADSKNEFMVDRLDIAFGFWDLAMGNGRIEGFQLKNLRFSKDSAYDFKLETAGIEKSKDASFAFQGEFGGEAFDARIPLKTDDSARPSYSFDQKNIVTGHYGRLALKADIIRSMEATAPVIENLELSQSGIVVATGKGIRKDGDLKITLDCKAAEAGKYPEEFISLRKIPYMNLSEGCPK